MKVGRPDIVVGIAWRRAAGSAHRAARRPALERIALGSVLALIVADALRLPSFAVAAIAGIATVAHGARLIALENSKSFAESPIGGGPIVRVGDATSTFDPDLTYRCGKIAQQIAAQDPSFKYQRKLMPGGTCEASAYQTYGYTATCLCLPLGNYHNMNEAAGKIDSEFISLSDKTLEPVFYGGTSRKQDKWNVTRRFLASDLGT